MRKAALAVGIAGALITGAPYARATGRAQDFRTHQKYERVLATANSEVQTAAFTLGAVTIGGLAMRAIVQTLRNPEAEQKEVEANCERLAQEEEERARRAARRKMEQVDEPTLDDDELRSALQNRMSSLNSDSDGDPGTEDDLSDELKKYMRNTPIPDRGTGSMLLDRPDDDDDDDDSNDGNASDDSESTNNPSDAPNQENLEFLKRMWNLSSPDDNERGK